MLILQKCLERKLKEFIFQWNDSADSLVKFFCRFFKQELAKLKEKMRDMVDWWIDGGDVIKKCNPEPHRAPNIYNSVVQRLREKRAVSSDCACTSDGQQLVIIKR